MSEHVTLPTPSIAPRPTADHDVVVIGAGAAGLAAADACIAAGLDTVVIEARQRIGGRAFTDEVAGQAFDAGAAYVHFRDRNPWVRIAKRVGLETAPHRGWGGGQGYDGSTRLDDEFRRNRDAARRTLWSRIDDIDTEKRDLSLADLAARGGETERWVAIRYAQQAIGEQPENVSVADLQSLWDGDDDVVPGGYGHLVAHVGRDIPVTLGAAATAVTWGASGVVVETAKGAIRATRAVITVPVGVLAAETIRFDPPLPAETRQAIADIGSGALTKVALAVDARRLGLPSPTDLFELRSGFVFECFPFDRSLVIATIGGEPAREMIRLGEAGAAAHATDVLAGILGETVRDHVIAGRLSDWVTDPFAQGSYSVARPGRFAAREVLGRPVADKLYFVGEATAGPGAMTVGGATMAGRAAAKVILKLHKLARR